MLICHTDSARNRFLHCCLHFIKSEYVDGSSECSANIVILIPSVQRRLTNTLVHVLLKIRSIIFFLKSGDITLPDKPYANFEPRVSKISLQINTGKRQLDIRGTMLTMLLLVFGV